MSSLKARSNNNMGKIPNNDKEFSSSSREDQDFNIELLKLEINHLYSITHHIEDIHKLSVRHKECLKWLIRGKSSVDIGLILGISKRTVEKHIATLKEKLGCYTLFQVGLKTVYLTKRF